MTAPPQRRQLNDPPPLKPLRAVRDEPAKPATKKPPKRDGTRWQTLNEFIDITLRDLTPRQVAVWLTLFRDCRNGVATVSQAYIAERCGLRRPTVSTTISTLEQLGLVTTIHCGGVGRGLSKYRVHSMIQTRK